MRKFWENPASSIPVPEDARVPESLQIGGRLTRGRSYARAGQVLELEVAAGSVAARVQGSRRTPYDV